MKFFRSIFLTLSVGLVLCLTVWLGGFIVFTGSVSAMKEQKIVLKTDGIIALTGGTNRINRALDLLHDQKAKALLVSGVNPDVTLRELLAVEQPDQKPQCCITLGRSADNTIGNALEARDWVRANDFHTIRIVTANYHMPRALLEFRHALPNITLIAHPILPNEFTPRTIKFWRLCFIEYHKLIITLVRIIFYPHATSPLPDEMKK